MRGEVHLAEARRRDAELVCYGLQQQVQLLERELGGLRQQVAQGNMTVGQKMTEAFGRLANRGPAAQSHEGLHLINSEMTQSRSELHSVRDNDTSGPRQTSFDQRAKVF